MKNDFYIDEFDQLLAPIETQETYLKQLFTIYHQRLLSSPDVLRKLERRGISDEVVKTNLIGHCDRKLNRYISKSEKPDGAAFRGALRRVGLTSVHGHEIFRGCIVEPIFEDDKVIAAMGIKLICPSRPAPRILHWYREQIYTKPLSFKLMTWGKRYVTH
jgi:hypothetical protein